MDQQVVKHKKWGYHGVIMGWDNKARAPDEWLKEMHGENTHWRDQPNYAVLVDTRDRPAPQMTYVPQVILPPFKRCTKSMKWAPPFITSIIHYFLRSTYFICQSNFTGKHRSDQEQKDPSPSGGRLLRELRRGAIFAPTLAQSFIPTWLKDLCFFIPINRTETCEICRQIPVNPGPRR